VRTIRLAVALGARGNSGSSVEERDASRNHDAAIAHDGAVTADATASDSGVRDASIDAGARLGAAAWIRAHFADVTVQGSA